MQAETTPNTLRSNIKQLLQAISESTAKLINLAFLEGRLAGISLLSIVGLLLTGSFLIFAAWLILLIAGALWLTSLHFSLIITLLIMSMVNLLLLIPVSLLIKYFFKKLLFPATRRQLAASTTHVTGAL